MMSINKHWDNHYKIHMWWIIGVLITIIIGLLSWKIGSNESVKDPLNFAVSFASLILAILAIGQALISGGALPDAVAAVREAISEVKAPAGQLATAAEIIGNHTASIEERTKSFIGLFDKIANQPNNPSDKNKSDKSKNNIILSDELLARSSVVFRVSLFVVLQSNKTKISYISHKLAGDRARSLNIVGAISALDSMGIVGVDKNESGLSYISDLGQLNWLTDFENELSKPRNENQKNYYESVFVHVQTYFGLLEDRKIE